MQAALSCRPPSAHPHAPLGVRPYWPARRLPKRRRDPAFDTKPQLVWAQIQPAQAVGTPLQLGPADAIHGRNAHLEATLVSPDPLRHRAAPSHRTWHSVENPEHPPGLTRPKPRSSYLLAPGSAQCGKAAMARCWCAALPRSNSGARSGVEHGMRLIAATLTLGRLTPAST